MAEIRIDQSHCNSYLSEALSQQDWAILFRDPGRVSRGGVGSQGDALRIFELSGLPIPDIVGVRGSCLLLIEVDTSYKKAERSFLLYLENAKYLIEQFCISSPSVSLERLILGFCRTNMTKKTRDYIAKLEIQAPFIGLWVTFEEPRKPLLYWTN